MKITQEDVDEILEAIEDFDKRCTKTDYTDVGEAWMLLDYIRKTLRNP